MVFRKTCEGFRGFGNYYNFLGKIQVSLVKLTPRISWIKNKNRQEKTRVLQRAFSILIFEFQEYLDSNVLLGSEVLFQILYEDIQELLGAFVPGPLIFFPFRVNV